MRSILYEKPFLFHFKYNKFIFNDKEVCLTNTKRFREQHGMKNRGKQKEKQAKQFVK